MLPSVLLANGSGIDHSQRADMTLTILGCGTLGVAILSGILASISETETRESRAYESQTKTQTYEHSFRTPTKFIACVRRQQSVQHIRDALSPWPRIPVDVLHNENVKGVQLADVVILCCKPSQVKEIFWDVIGMREALRGKLLISILAGVSAEQIENILFPEPSFLQDRCRIVRVMPNTAAVIRESMTVIATSDPPLPIEWDALVTWIFTRIGRVTRLPASAMDVSTAMAGSGPAFMALFLESIVDGAVAMGMPRAEAQLIACQVMRGTAEMVLSGDHPALIREKVSTPGGCTIGGLLILEEAGVRGSIARSIRETTVVASELGKGVRNVNGTRH